MCIYNSKKKFHQNRTGKYLRHSTEVQCETPEQKSECKIYLQSKRLSKSFIADGTNVRPLTCCRKCTRMYFEFFEGNFVRIKNTWEH